jgi:hypothetical protein
MFLTRSSRPILSLKCRQRLFAQTCYASTTYSDRFKLVSLRSISADELGHPILNKKERCGVKTTTDVTSFAIKCAKVILLILSYSFFSDLFSGEFNRGDSGDVAFDFFA